DDPDLSLSGHGEVLHRLADSTILRGAPQPRCTHTREAFEGKLILCKPRTRTTVAVPRLDHSFLWNVASSIRASYGTPAVNLHSQRDWIVDPGVFLASLCGT